MPYDALPSKASLKPEKSRAHATDEELEDFKTALKLSRIGPKTYEDQVADPKDYRSFGISRKWLEDSRDHWINNYDWRKTENKINTYNNWAVDIEHDGFQFHTHFVGLISKKADAVPLLLMHGWPGSFLEFLQVIDVLKNKYDEGGLPFHNFNVGGVAQVMDKLMNGLGFVDVYVAQGGYIGSFVARVLYWFTEWFPRAIYGYRQFFGNLPQFFHDDKPMGYIQHPQELASVLISLVKKTGYLGLSCEAPDGGHFYAMETPKRFMDDMLDFVGQVWKSLPMR